MIIEARFNWEGFLVIIQTRKVKQYHYSLLPSHTVILEYFNIKEKALSDFAFHNC